MELIKKQFDKVLERQCKLVGVDYKKFFKSFLSGKKMPDGWYLKHSWTEDKEAEFKKWLVTYLMKILHLSKRCAEEYASWWILDYGWKTQEKEK